MTLKIVEKPKPPATFLPQKSLLIVDMRPYHIVLFVVGLIVGNWALHKYKWDPSPEKLSLEEKLNVDNPVMKTLLVTSVVNLMMLPALAFWVVYWATKNNSFSNNPEDYNTGSQIQPPSARDHDADHTRANNLHRNALENIPMAVLCSLLMVIAGPDPNAAKTYMIVYTVSRLLHLFWYWNAGSHEIRAVFYTIGVFCNVGCCFQILRACGVVF